MFKKTIKMAREQMGKAFPGLRAYNENIEWHFYAESAMRGEREMLVFSNRKENKVVGFWMESIGDDPYSNSYCQVFLTTTKEKFNDNPDFNVEHNRFVLTFGTKYPIPQDTPQVGLDVKAVFFPDQFFLIKPEKVLIKNPEGKWMDINNYVNTIINTKDKTLFLDCINLDIRDAVHKSVLFADATEYHSKKMAENPYLSQKQILSHEYFDMIFTPNRQVIFTQKNIEGKED